MTGSIALEKLVAISSDSIARAKRVFEPLRKILFFNVEDGAIRPKRSLALSIEPGRVCIVYGTRSFSRIEVKGARTSPFKEGKYPTPANVASALALARSESKASPHEVILSIPKTWAVTRLVELPVTVKENLANVVSYELDRLTPFTSDSALFDFRIVSEGEGKLSIMLIAAKADLINPYLEAIRESGMAVDRVTVSPSAIGTLCSHGPAGQNTVFANIGENGYEVGLVLDNLLASYCAGNIDAHGGTSSLNTVVEEIDRCKAAGARKAGPPRLVLCTGEGELATRLKTQVPSAIDLSQGMGGGLKLPQPIGSISPSAAGGMLESLWPQAKGFNLLQKGRHEETGTPAIFTLVLVLALVAMGVVYVISPLRMEKMRLGQIEQRIAAIRGEVKKVEALKKDVGALEAEVATIEKFKKSRPMALQILKELTTLLPKNAWLTRTRITDTTVEIEGYAPAATELLSKLEGSPLLKKVEFASPTFRDVRLNSDRFVIKMEIEGPVKETEGRPNRETEGKVKQ
jgi:Tfp pilus assembly protein PilN